MGTSVVDTKRLSVARVCLLVAFVLLAFLYCLRQVHDSSSGAGLFLRQVGSTRTRGYLGVAVRKHRVPPTTTDSISAGIKWFQDNGGYLHPNVVFKPRPSNPNVRGAFATGVVRQGAKIATVPLHLFLTSKKALGLLVSELNENSLHRDGSAHVTTPSEVMKALGLAAGSTKQRTKQRQLAVLALYLAVHRDNTDNFFYPYFQMMPKDCQNWICWPQGRLEKVFRKDALDNLDQTRGIYVGMAKRLGIDPAEFLVQISIAQSRYWNDPTAAKEHTMIPIVDMFNHPEKGSGQLLSFRTNQFQGARLNQRSEGKEGDELFESYGPKNSAQLLETYGFRFDYNAHDTCTKLRRDFTDDYLANNVVLLNGERCPVSAT